MDVNHKGCKSCVYGYTINTYMITCDYFLKTGKRRPCPGGEGCTVKIKRKKGETKDVKD